MPIIDNLLSNLKILPTHKVFAFREATSDSLLQKIVADNKSEIEKLDNKARALARENMDPKKKTAQLEIRYTLIQLKKPDQKLLTFYARSDIASMREIFAINKNENGDYVLGSTDLGIEEIDDTADDGIAETENAKRLSYISKTETIGKN